jgi:hypothetical protein
VSLIISGEQQQTKMIYNKITIIVLSFVLDCCRFRMSLSFYPVAVVVVVVVVLVVLLRVMIIGIIGRL